MILASCSTIFTQLDSNTMIEKEADIEKYNSYIEFLNFQNGWFDAVVETYFSTFGIEEELTIKADFKGFTLDPVEGQTIYGIHHGFHTEKPLQYLKAKPDYGEADDIMPILCDKFEAFLTFYFRDVNEYYKNKEYEKDNFEKGRQFHKKMITDYSELIDVANNFLMAFSSKMLENEAAELPYLKANGYDIHYYALSLLLNAKKISNMFENLEREGKTFLEADLVQYKELFDAFNDDVEAFKLIYKDEARLKQEDYGQINIAFLNQFATTAEMMQTSATDALNMIKAGTTEIDNELTGKVTTGGVNNPISRFNARSDMLISQYNQSID